MPNLQIIYNICKQKFDEGILDITPYSCDMIDHDLHKHFVLTFMTQLDATSWIAQDMFQFALILTYFNFDYKDFLFEVPDLTYFPFRIDFNKKVSSWMLGRSLPIIIPLTKRSEPCRKALLDIL